MNTFSILRAAPAKVSEVYWNSGRKEKIEPDFMDKGTLSQVEASAQSGKKTELFFSGIYPGGSVDKTLDGKETGQVRASSRFFIYSNLSRKSML